MPFSGNGDGLTWDTAYEITQPEHWFELENGFKYKFLNEINISGLPPSRMVGLQAEIDMQGYGVVGVDDIEFGSFLKDFAGILKNGYIEFNLTYTSGNIFMFSGGIDDAVGSGPIMNIDLRGHFESTTGYAGVFDVYRSNAIGHNIKISADIISAGTGNAFIFGSSNSRPDLKNIFVTGTLTANGTGVTQVYNDFFADFNGRVHNCFIDVTKNPNLTANRPSDGAIYAGFTTAQLQQLQTYTDPKYLTRYPLIDGTVSIAQGSQTVTGVNTIFTDSSPGDEIAIGPAGPNREIFTIDSIVSDTEMTVTDPASIAHTDEILSTDSFETISIANVGSYVNEDWVIDDGNAYPLLKWEVEIAASGVVTYGIGHPNEGQPVEGAKVFYLEADDDSLLNATVIEEQVTGADGKHQMTSTPTPGKVLAYVTHFKDDTGSGIDYYSSPIRIVNSTL